MLQSLRIGLTLGLLALAGAGTVQAQDRSMMKRDSSSRDKMDHGMMKKDAMMAPHGTFAGAHDHIVTGSYQVIDHDGRKAVVLGEDFLLDGAPDPYIVLSADEMGSGSQALNLGRLRRNRGSSTFAVPAGTELSRFKHVLVWCKKYSVTLGAAELAAGGAMTQN